MLKIESKDLVGLRGVLADWRARMLKRASMPVGMTVRDLTQRLAMCDRMISDITAEIGDVWEEDAELPLE